MSASTIEGPSGARLEHEQFPHLTRFEWEGLHRLSQISGEAVITALLSTGTEQQHRLAAQEFMARELADARRQALTPAQPKMNKADIVKLDVSSYNGEGVKRMALNRWFCEIDMAVAARQLTTEFARTNFLMSKLAGKAKEWALGRRVADPSCFMTMEEVKDDLRLAFEPPQDEVQQRTAFLNLKQGKLSMRDYIQHARHLVSCIVDNPIDMTTQVHVFVTGMNAGFQRFYLTRKPAATLEEAFATALREDYSVTASRAFPTSRAFDANEAVPMEIDAIESNSPHRYDPSQSRGRGRGSSGGQRAMLCFRCRKPGHRAAVCRAPAPVLAAVDATDGPVPSGQSKIGDDQ
jgi:hypothetical protein